MFAAACATSRSQSTPGGVPSSGVVTTGPSVSAKSRCFAPWSCGANHSTSGVKPPIAPPAPMIPATRSTDSAPGTPGSPSTALIAAGVAKTKSPASSKIRTEGGRSTGARKTTSASGYSACSRAWPPPVKNACSVCAASWITMSPSIRPGQPRSRSWSTGENMHSLTVSPSLGLRMHDDVGDLWMLPPDELLDPARVGVRGRECAGAEPQRQVGDEPLVGVDEPQLRGIDAQLGADDAAHRRGVARDLGAGRFLRERLEVRPHRGHLRNRELDRPLDLLGDRMRLLQRELAGKLEVKRELGAAVDGDDRDVVHLADARHVERRGMRALPHVCVVRLDRLDVDDDVRFRQRRLHRAL